MHNVPSAFQKRTLWTALTALAIALMGGLLVGLVILVAKVLAFLQPLLVPFAVAGVIAYLLEPLVLRLMKWRLSRQNAVLLVFSVATILLVGAAILVVPVALKQGAQFRHALPRYAKVASQKVSDWAMSTNEQLRREFGIDVFKGGFVKDSAGGAAPSTPAKVPAATADGAPAPAPAPTSATTPPTTGAAVPDKASAEAGDEDVQKMMGDWLEKELPVLMNHFWDFFKSGIGGFLGAFGFAISLVIVPLYLYYFLTEAPKISQGWQDYVPLRASRFKDEVVGTLTEINRYLIAFFRGQLVVSMINGIATAVGLTIIGLNFGWLIGIALCFLGIVPYVGIAVCWLPAIIIASVQGGSWLIAPTHPWWVFPLAVTGVFTLVQQIDSFFITPRVVGESVGLHPLTVIVSVIAWSLILGGLLGAILAVPMTAAVKVLFQRYVWTRAIAVGLPARE